MWPKTPQISGRSHLDHGHVEYLHSADHVGKNSLATNDKKLPRVAHAVRRALKGSLVRA